MGGASTSSVKVAWDTSCLNPAPERVDIYLLSPEKAANLGQVTVWSNVPYSLGQFDIQLDSTLWGSTPSVDLQVQIIQAGTLVFLSQMAAGPVFKVVNPSPSTASPSTAGSNSIVNSVTGGSKRQAPFSVLSSLWLMLMSSLCGRRIFLNLNHCAPEQLHLRYLARLCCKIRQPRSHRWKARCEHRYAHPHCMLYHRGLCILLPSS